MADFAPDLSNVRRIRHIQKILIRNINLSCLDGPTTTTMSLSVPPGPSHPSRLPAPFYTSIPASNTLNPTYDEVTTNINFMAFETDAAIAMAQQCVLRVHWSGQNTKKHPKLKSWQPFDFVNQVIPPAHSAEALRVTRKGPGRTPSPRHRRRGRSSRQSLSPDAKPRRAVSPMSGPLPVQEDAPNPRPKWGWKAQDAKSDICLFETLIDVSKLHRFHTPQLDSLPNLPPNSLVVQLQDGCYGSHKLVKFLLKTSKVKMPAAVVSRRSVLEIGTMLSKVTTIYGKCAEIHSMRAANKATEGLIMQSLKANSRALAKNMATFARQERVANIKKQIEEEKKKLAASKERRQELYDKLHDGLTVLRESRDSLKLIQEAVTEQGLYTETGGNKCIELDNLLESRRQKLLGGLWEIYPISTERASSGSGGQRKPYKAIRRIPLPSKKPLTMYPEENISTALGMVCHMQMLVSKYMSIPLPFRVVYHASRSHIIDPLQGRGTSHDYPLYFKNKNLDEFDTATKLLDRNIEHLLVARVPDWGKATSSGTLEQMLRVQLFYNHKKRSRARPTTSRHQARIKRHVSSGSHSFPSRASTTVSTTKSTASARPSRAQTILKG